MNFGTPGNNSSGFLLEVKLKRRTAIYARVSTQMQSTGLDSQLRALKDYCKRNGIDDYLIFEDEGISGAKRDRPALNEMIEMVKSNEISSVVVFSFSRFARSTKQLLEALEMFREHKTEFISLSENIDTSTAIGEIFFTIIASLAQFERSQLISRIKNGLEGAKARGVQLGRKKTRPTESILELRNKGFTYRQIAKLLNVSQGTVRNALKESEQKKNKK